MLSNKIVQHSEQVLQKAVRHGVVQLPEETSYTFFDPGISILSLGMIPVVQEKKLFQAKDWYELEWHRQWCQHVDPPQERMIRIPVDGSKGIAFAEQKRLLLPGESIASARIEAVFLVIHALSTGGCLTRDWAVRSSDVGSPFFCSSVVVDCDEYHIAVGPSPVDSGFVCLFSDRVTKKGQHRFPNVAVAAVRSL